MTFKQWLDWEILSTDEELLKWKAHFERDPADALYWVDMTVTHAAKLHLYKQIQSALAKPEGSMEKTIVWIRQEIKHLSTTGVVRSTAILNQALHSERLRAMYRVLEVYEGGLT